ncbi:MAG: hypothetical protein JWP50_187, partial [Phenylobacterium sp.]|nr:hypothetical protein [Phenylobacterium sp.]
KATVERLIWTETETQEREDHLCDLLETFLDEDDLHGRLADGDIDAHIARICGEIGLPLALPIRGEGGPSAERSEERMVGGAGFCSGVAAPSTTPSAGRGPPPPSMGEAEDWRSSA